MSTANDKRGTVAEAETRGAKHKAATAGRPRVVTATRPAGTSQPGTTAAEAGEAGPAAASRANRKVTARRRRSGRAEAERSGTKCRGTESATRKAAAKAETNGQKRMGRIRSMNKTGSNKPRQVTAARLRFLLNVKSLGVGSGPCAGTLDA